MCMPRYFGVKTVEIKIKKKKSLTASKKRKIKTIHQSKVNFEWDFKWNRLKIENGQWKIKNIYFVGFVENF